MEEIKKGEEIVKAFYKASLKALMSIGVKSPEYIDKFSDAFGKALDQEFMAIGLIKPPTPEVVEVKKEEPKVEVKVEPEVKQEVTNSKPE